METDAAVADRSANTGRIVGAMEGVPLTHDEAMCTEHAFVFALVGTERWDDDVPAHHDLVPFPNRADRLFSPVWIPAYDVRTGHGDLRAVAGRDGLAAVEAHDPEPPLARLFNEVPVGRNPRRIQFLGLDHQPAARCLELPVGLAAGALEDLATSRRDLCREQHAVAQLVPQPVVLDAHDEVGLRRRDGAARRLTDH